MSIAESPAASKKSRTNPAEKAATKLAAKRDRRARKPKPWKPLPPEPLMTGGRDAWDSRTHIERINETGSGNPAHIPGQGVVHVRDEDRRG